MRVIVQAVSQAQRTTLRGLTDKESMSFLRRLQSALAAGNDLSRALMREAATV